ncbi:MAG: SRPBCC family protein [Acidimicrobiales bacterium]|nr:SRPBCC family protein [Acidimicrobiales bacterium]
MAYTCAEFAAPVETVFAVLTDPTTYPSWLIGAADIRSIDRSWPAPGSRFHHRVGVGPFTLADSTEVLEIEPDRMLRLAVRARPLIAAVATFRLIGEPGRSVVTLEEEPSHRIIGNLVRPVLDPLTHLRNQRSLRHLVELVEHGRAGTAGMIEPAAG